MIHWILTGLSTALAACTLACALVAYRSAAALVRERARIRQLEDQMAVTADFQSRQGESIARLNGRYGALRAELGKQRKVRYSDGSDTGFIVMDPADMGEVDPEEERKAAERETLRQKLAAKVNH